MGRAVFPPLFYLRPNYGGGNDDNGDLLQKALQRHCCTLCPRPCSSHQHTRLCRRLLGTPGQAWVTLGSLLLSPRSWRPRFCCALQEAVSQSCVSYGGSMMGLLATSSKRAYATPRSAAPRASAKVHCWPYLLRRHWDAALSQSLWGVWVLVHTTYVWALWASLAGMGFKCKC